MQSAFWFAESECRALYSRTCSGSLTVLSPFPPPDESAPREVSRVSTVPTIATAPPRPGSSPSPCFPGASTCSVISKATTKLPSPGYHLLTWREARGVVGWGAQPTGVCLARTCVQPSLNQLPTIRNRETAYRGWIFSFSRKSVR